MRATQSDLFAQHERFEALIARRLPAAELLVVADVASALNVTRTKVLELMDEGLIHAVNINEGTNLRPFYKIMRESVLQYARRLDKGW
jgi:hypothetical protein